MTAWVEFVILTVQSEPAPGLLTKGVSVLPGRFSGSCQGKQVVKYLEAKKGCREMEIHLLKPKNFP